MRNLVQSSPRQINKMQAAKLIYSDLLCFVVSKWAFPQINFIPIFRWAKLMMHFVCFARRRQCKWIQPAQAHTTKCINDSDPKSHLKQFNFKYEELCRSRIAAQCGFVEGFHLRTNAISIPLFFSLSFRWAFGFFEHSCIIITQSVVRRVHAFVDAERCDCIIETENYFPAKYLPGVEIIWDVGGFLWLFCERNEK